MRLKGYDYAQVGAYFVTICAHRGGSIFGRVADGEIFLNDNGQLVWMCWNDLPHH